MLLSIGIGILSIIVIVVVAVIINMNKNNNENFNQNDDKCSPKTLCREQKGYAWDGKFKSEFCNKIRKGTYKGEGKGWGAPYLFPLEEKDGFKHMKDKHKRSRYPDGKRYLGESCDNKCNCCNADGIEYPHIKAQCCEAAKRIKGSDLEKDYYDEDGNPVDDNFRFPKVSECRVNIGGSGLSID